MACASLSPPRASRALSSAAGAGSGKPPLAQLGKGEGALILLQWPGYSDPSFARSFERSTGCTITRTNVVGSSADMARLLRNGTYDLVSASGDVSGDAHRRDSSSSRSNVGLVPAWRQLAPPFRSPAFNTVNGTHYGVTVMWTPNALLYQTQRAKPAPTTWRAVYDDRFRGKVSVPDNPMQIADAALYLRSTNAGAPHSRPVRADAAAVRRGRRAPPPPAPARRALLAVRDRADLGLSHG